MHIEEKLAAMGLVLPPEVKSAPGSSPPHYIRVRNGIAYLSGQGARNADGTSAGPFGKVPSEVSIEAARESAKGCALSLLGTLQCEIGDLDRVTQWLRVFGMVNCAPGFNRTTPVINGFSDLVIELFGKEKGAHTRSAVGMAELPLDIPVEVEAEIEIAV